MYKIRSNEDWTLLRSSVFGCVLLDNDVKGKEVVEDMKMKRKNVKNLKKEMKRQEPKTLKLK